MKSDSFPSSTVIFLVIFAAIFLLHLPLLRLPYFWDEAGYYIPAARDLLLTGSVIPHSTPSNAHPPLGDGVPRGLLEDCGIFAVRDPLGHVAGRGI